MGLTVPAPVGWLVLALVFVDELLLIAGGIDVGRHLGGWAVGLLLGLIVVGAWFLFASPKAAYAGRLGRPVTKGVVVGAVCGGLWAVGHDVAAPALLAFSLVINVLASMPSIARLASAESGRAGRSG